jgi:hypothetical protein
VTAIALSSPRVRRRLVWAGVAGAVVLAIVLASVLMPSHGASTADNGGAVAARAKAETPAKTHTPASARPYAEPPTVPVPRAAINSLLDRFIPAVIERKNLAAGWNLVTPQARGSRAEWQQGTTPFQTFPARDKTFRGWQVNYSYAGDVGFDIFLAPTDPKHVSMTFRGEAKKIGGSWKIAVFYPQATFQPVGKRAAVWADTDLQPQAVGNAAKTGRLGAAWLLFPAGLLGAALLGGLGFAAFRMTRRRARVREIERRLAATREASLPG